jgi:hypothetical protein
LAHTEKCWEYRFLLYNQLLRLINFMHQKLGRTNENQPTWVHVMVTKLKDQGVPLDSLKEVNDVDQFISKCTCSLSLLFCHE